MSGAFQRGRRRNAYGGGPSPGKAALFGRFGGVDAVPLCLACTDVGELAETVAALAPSFGGINLEDISAPRCFEVQDRLRERLDIPVFQTTSTGLPPRLAPKASPGSSAGSPGGNEFCVIVSPAGW